MNLRTVDANEPDIDGDVCLDPVGFAAELLERGSKQRVDRPQLGRPSRRAGFESRQIEQILDEPLEAADLDPDPLEELFALSFVQLTGRNFQPSIHGATYGKRGCQ